MKKLLIIGIALGFMSCRQERIDELEIKIADLEQQISIKDSLIKEKDKSIDGFIKSLIERTRPKENNLSELEIIDIVKKDREYYCPNAKRKNFVVKKVNDKTYDVRFDFFPTGGHFLKEWSIVVYRLNLLPNDKYNLKLYSGASCF